MIRGSRMQLWFSFSFWDVCIIKSGWYPAMVWVGPWRMILRIIGKSWNRSLHPPMSCQLPGCIDTGIGMHECRQNLSARNLSLQLNLWNRTKCLLQLLLVSTHTYPCYMDSRRLYVWASLFGLPLAAVLIVISLPFFLFSIGTHCSCLFWIVLNREQFTDHGPFSLLRSRILYRMDALFAYGTNGCKVQPSS